MAWRGFYRESVSYVNPKTRKEWISFYLNYPRAFCRFHWFGLVDSYRGLYYKYIFPKTHKFLD